MKVRLALVVLSGLLIAARVPMEEVPNTETDPASLLGTWIVVKEESYDGKKHEVLDAQTIRMTFAGQELVVASEGDPAKESYKYVLVSATRDPNEIDFTKKEETVRAVFELKKDKLRLCWDSTNCDKRPKKLQVSPYTSLRLVTLMRDRKGR